MTTHKFHYMSDIHLEFGMPKFMPIEGENIILAGDITCLRALNPRMTDAQNRKLRDRTLLFFDTMRENFKRVFYVTGNHESYGCNINQEADYIKEYLPGIIHLNDSSYVLDNETVVVGNTLWTDMNRGNPIDMLEIKHGLNDFRLITKDSFLTKFEPEDAYELYKKTMSYFENTVQRYVNKKIVIVTHHAPTYKGINPIHVNGKLNAAYATDLEQFIIDHSQIKAWVFGHTHIQKRMMIGKTQVVSNARGYEGYEHSAETFNPDTWFEV